MAIALQPRLTTVIFLSLAFGVGDDTAIFSLINAVMLRKLPVEDPGQLVLLNWVSRKGPARVEIESGENGDALS